VSDAVTRIRLISFDFWSTLVWSNPHYKRRRIELVATAFGSVGPAAARYALAVADAELDEATERTGHQYGLPDRLARIAALLGRPELTRGELDDLRDRHDNAFLRDPPTLTETMLPATLSALREAGYRLAVTSNTGFIAGRLLRATLPDVGLGWHIFEHLVFSDEVGHAKPAPEIFQHLTALARCRAGEALHVGDNKRTDVDGARAAGLHALWYRPHAPPSGGTIGSHSELPDHPALSGTPPAQR
jgi:putative hydrolase of the HAD superfamily